MNNDIKVSIITVCRNSEKTIERTIESVFAQTYKNIEYIIIDGASTDNTKKIILEWQPKFGERLKLLSEPDDGIYYAMNKGISLASGELIGLINSDDWYEEDAVEIMIDKYLSLHNKEFVVLYGLLKLWDASGKEKGVLKQDHSRYRITMIPHPTCFISRKTYEKYGLYDTAYLYVADYDYIIKLNEAGAVSFCLVNRIIANFTTGGASSGMKWRRELHRLRKDHGINVVYEYGKELFARIKNGNR